MWRKKFKYTDDKPKKKKASKFKSINVVPLDEQINEGKKVKKPNFSDKENKKNIDVISDLPLVKKMHKGEDEEFYNDKIDCIDGESKDKVNLNSCDGNPKVVKSNLDGVNISIEYLD